MIKDRQKAFHSGNIPAWRSLKYKVQQEKANRKKSFYKNKVQHLKHDDCRKWRNIVNKMSGRFAKPSFFPIERDGKTISQRELVNSLNQFYVSINADIPPLYSNILPAFLPAEASVLTVQPHEVCPCSPSNRQRLTLRKTYRAASLKSSHMNWLNLSPLSSIHHSDLV